MAHENLLLASLSPSDVALLQPHLKSVLLKQHQVLFDVDDEVRAAYFPLSAIVSLVVTLEEGSTVEATMVGRDGAMGLSYALGDPKALCKSVVQHEGEALVGDVNAIKDAALHSATLLSTLVRNEQALFAQAQQSAACLANHTIESRLCRWLLRARDLAGTDTLLLTQEYLAEMLGAQRTSITVAANTLQRAGMIEYRRGRIQIVDADAMGEAACECFAVVKENQEQLLGRSNWSRASLSRP
jgi:CRP-like cAMP-binding protein